MKKLKLRPLKIHKKKGVKYVIINGKRVNITNLSKREISKIRSRIGYPKIRAAPVGTKYGIAKNMLRQGMFGKASRRSGRTKKETEEILSLRRELNNMIYQRNDLQNKIFGLESKVKKYDDNLSSAAAKKQDNNQKELLVAIGQKNDIDKIQMKLKKAKYDIAMNKEAIQMLHHGAREKLGEVYQKLGEHETHITQRRARSEEKKMTIPARKNKVPVKVLKENLIQNARTLQAQALMDKDIGRVQKLAGIEKRTKKFSDAEEYVKETFSPNTVRTLLEAPEKIPEKNFGKGKDQQMDAKYQRGMSDLQVNDLLDIYPNYYGAIVLDDLQKTLDKIKQNFNKYEKHGFVFLLEGDQYANGHWVSVIIDRAKKYVGYYNSFGYDAQNFVKEQITKSLDDMEIPYEIKWKYNKFKVQADDSDLCGWFAAYTLALLFHNHPWTESTFLTGSKFKTEWTPDEQKKGEI